MDPIRIAFATGSSHKLKEVRQILNPKGIEVISPKDLGLDFQPEETEETFAGNSLIKSKELFHRTGIPSLADDSGICVEALGGRPGVYSARYGEPQWTDEERTLGLLRELGNSSNRKAFYSCVLSFVTKNGEELFEGLSFGIIANDYDRIGKNGFGYDPIFIPEGSNLRFSQMEPVAKNSLSHRGRAFQKFLEFLESPKGQKFLQD